MKERNDVMRYGKATLEQTKEQLQQAQSAVSALESGCLTCIR